MSSLSQPCYIGSPCHVGHLGHIESITLIDTRLKNDNGAITMSISINGQQFDTTAEACSRLRLSRKTLIKYIDDGLFTQPDRHLQGTKQNVRYFTNEWYAINEPVLRQQRGETVASAAETPVSVSEDGPSDEIVGAEADSQVDDDSKPSQD